MLENIGSYTPKIIYNTVTECHSMMKSKKYRDKHSRAAIERSRNTVSEIEKELFKLKDYNEIPLNDIVINDVHVDYSVLRNQLIDYMFFLLRVKNNRINISDVAESVAKYLNESIFK